MEFIILKLLICSLRTTLLLKRFGYDYKDISSFRNNIVKFIVPLCMKMNELKKEELGLEKLEYFDTIFFEEMPELKMFGREMLSELKKC